MEKQAGLDGLLKTIKDFASNNKEMIIGGLAGSGLGAIGGYNLVDDYGLSEDETYNARLRGGIIGGLTGLLGGGLAGHLVGTAGGAAAAGSGGEKDKPKVENKPMQSDNEARVSTDTNGPSEEELKKLDDLVNGNGGHKNPFDPNSTGGSEEPGVVPTYPENYAADAAAAAGGALLAYGTADRVAGGVRNMRVNHARKNLAKARLANGKAIIADNAAVDAYLNQDKAVNGLANDVRNPRPGYSKATVNAIGKDLEQAKKVLAGLEAAENKAFTHLGSAAGKVTARRAAYDTAKKLSKNMPPRLKALWVVGGTAAGGGTSYATQHGSNN